jgi:hypothetical protein
MTPSSPDPSPGGLRDLLHDLAEEQPAVRVAPDTWQRGRSAHRRGVVLASVATAAAVGLFAVGGTTLVRDVSGSDVPDPAGSSTPLALPSHVHALPEHGNRVQGDVATWQPDFAARTVAVGPLSVVFPSDGGSDPGIVGVSAESGDYLGLDLPGLQAAGVFRDETNVAALSADGTRLAYAWSRGGIDQAPSGVRVLDLRTGEATTHRIPAPYGVLVSGLSWSPDQRFVAFNASVYTDGSGTIRGARHFTVRRLDRRTGAIETVPDLQRGEGATTVNDAGDVRVPGSATLPQDGGEDRLVIEGSTTTVAWSTAGTELALGMAEGDVGVVRRTGGASFLSTPWQEAEADDPAPAQVLGWAGPATVAARSSDDDRVLLLSTTSTREPRTLLTMDPAVQFPSVATDLLGEPTRDYPTPGWAERWYDNPLVWFGGVGAVALLVLGLSVVRRRRAGA